MAHTITSNMWAAMPRFALLVSESLSGEGGAMRTRSELNRMVRGFAAQSARLVPADGLQFKDFLRPQRLPATEVWLQTSSTLDEQQQYFKGKQRLGRCAAAADKLMDTSGVQATPGAKKVFIETYGCQMNLSDSEASSLCSLLRSQSCLHHADQCMARRSCDQCWRGRATATRQPRRVQT